MITAQDLRIGNWLMNDGCPVRVRFINDYLTVKTKQGNDITARLELVKPIPLTPEILIKAGFFQYNEDEFYINDDAKCTEILRLFRKDDAYNFGYYPAAIKSLHQLQNLYFALTGQELEVKF